MLTPKLKLNKDGCAAYPQYAGKIYTAKTWAKKLPEPHRDEWLVIISENENLENSKNATSEIVFEWVPVPDYIHTVFAASYVGEKMTRREWNTKVGCHTTRHLIATGILKQAAR